MSAVLSPSQGAIAAESSAPAVGECHELFYPQIRKQSDTAAPVDCSVKHTALTISVTTVPDSVWDEGVEERLRYASQTCVKARDAYFGVDRDELERTMFKVPVFFLPTADEIAAGERFVRCDVVKMAGKGVYRLPADPRFDKVTRKVALCLTARFKPTACSTGTHRYYPTVAVRLPRPAVGEEVEASSRRCRAATGQSPPAVSWASWDWRTYTVAVCYRRD